MGLVGLPVISQKLIEHGMSEDMPIALVEQGTTSKQRTFTGTLGTLVEQIKDEDVHAPTLTIIGSVVSLHKQLAWFNT
jgi:uroporphyrin-III C-methyltransferase/precorrin-2 dehydrogenase/sirohydrochlorin ferrochelatase